MTVFSFLNQFVPYTSLSSVRWSELWQCLSIHQDKSSYSYIYSESILVHLTFFPVAVFPSFVLPNVRTVGSPSPSKLVRTRLAMLMPPNHLHFLYVFSFQYCFLLHFFNPNFIYRELFSSCHVWMLCTNSQLTHKVAPSALSYMAAISAAGLLVWKSQSS